MGLLKKNIFGQYLFIKKWIIRILGTISHQRYHGFNELKIEGSDVLRELPQTNVLFISNHQTYFADVVAMFHVFNAALSGRDDTLKKVGYLWNPKLNLYYVAAKETMKAGLLPKIFAYAGSISIERTWRDSGKDVNRQVKMSDISNIKKALDDGWVITFPLVFFLMVNYFQISNWGDSMEKKETLWSHLLPMLQENKRDGILKNGVNASISF